MKLAIERKCVCVPHERVVRRYPRLHLDRSARVSRTKQYVELVNRGQRVFGNRLKLLLAPTSSGCCRTYSFKSLCACDSPLPPNFRAGTTAATTGFSRTFAIRPKSSPLLDRLQRLAALIEKMLHELSQVGWHLCPCSRPTGHR